MSVFQLFRRAPTSNGFRCICRTYTTEVPKVAKKPSAGSSQQAVIPVSSCPVDTIMPGLNYLKGQAPVAALADDAYPEWLWGVLQPREFEDDGPGGLKERKERRKIRQQAIKDRNFMQTQ